MPKPRAISYIRFSSKAQGAANRDSLRRQEMLFAEFVEENDLEVLDDLQVRDLGVSGYTGANLEKGLKDILDYIKEGRIQPGDYLCLESLDRLSRDNVWTSIGVLSSIITSGVKVATLSHSEKRIYDHRSNDVMSELMWSVMILSRANEESALKSKRLQSVWQNKRREAHLKPMTGRCPGWLELRSDDRKFVIREDRAAVIRDIFDMSDAGIGSGSIAKIINGKGIAPFSRTAKLWSKSYIDKILANRSVIGEYQPHKSVHVRDQKGILRSKRQPEGEPIEDYFPKIVSEQLFNRVQTKRKNRRASPAGRKGQKFTNLLTGIAKCGYCGSTMNLVNKGTPPKGYVYLVCYQALHGGGQCAYKLYRYDQTEHMILKYLHDLPLHDVSEDDNSKIEQLRKAKRELTDRCEEVQHIQFNMMESIKKLNGTVSNAINKQLLELEHQEADLHSKIKDLNYQIALSDGDEKTALDRKEAFNKLLAELNRSAPHEVLEVREKLHARLRDISNGIFFFPLGFSGKKAPKTDFSFFVIKLKTGKTVYFSRVFEKFYKFEISIKQKNGKASPAEHCSELQFIITDLDTGALVETISNKEAALIKRKFDEAAILPFAGMEQHREAARSKFKEKILKNNNL